MTAGQHGARQAATDLRVLLEGELDRESQAVEPEPEQSRAVRKLDPWDLSTPLDNTN
jgi:hypothetical protein